MTPAERDEIAAEMCQWAYARRYWVAGRVGWTDVDDVIQHACMEACKYLHTDVVRVEFPRAVMSRLLHYAIANFYEYKSIRTDVHVSMEDLERIEPAWDGLSPEKLAIEAEEQANQKVVCIDALKQLRPKEAEILERFYLADEPRQEIQADLNLDDTAFRLTKSRAKARFGAFARAKTRFEALARESRPKAA